MKIICDNCAAKYSIADEKVAGKVFKIRCKKCSHVLEVRGDEFNDEDDATQVYDYGAESVWYVVIDGEQRGPLTPVELGELFTKGQVSRENYVWREGFGDWKTAGSIPELATFVGPDGPHRDDPTAELDLADERLRASETNGALSDSSGEIVASTPAAAAAGGGGGVDIFAAAAGESEPAPAQASPQRMTGQRNENSVLFSLGNLQQLATDGGSPSTSPASTSTSASSPAASSLAGLASASQPAASQKSAPLPAGEGSGLIDIRALAQASNAPSSRPAPIAQPTDLLSQVRSSFRSPSLGGSILAPAFDDSYKRQRWMIIGLVAALLLIAGMAAALVVVIKKPTQKVVVGAPSDAPAQVRVEQSPKPGPDPVPAIVAPAPEEPAAAEPPPEEPAAEPPPAPTVAKPAPKKRSPRKRTSSRTRSTPKTTSKPKTSSKSGSLEDLMDQVVGGSKSSSSSKSTSTSSSSRNTSGLPNAPGRTDVKRALSGVSGAVRSCKKDKSGTATVSVTFAGTTGRVKSARVVSGPFKGTPVGSCIGKAVKRARVPKFKQSTFNVKFPYRL